MINVLIVDDDRFARMGLISMIPWEDYGMKIVGEAANGRRALEFMRQNKVNLMFVDIAMPIMDGMQLIRSGLKVGERIIADGTHKVRPGMTVSPAPVKK